MPGVSTSVHISLCVGHIVRVNPRSVLDVGCGFGLWGFLCREYLDAWHSRVRREEWTTRIDGIEIFEPYIGDHQRAVYSSITIADIRDVTPNLDSYDLIITGDVIEHMPKEDALDLLRTLHKKANLALLVNIPLGEDGWDQGEAHGNPAEEHLSRWQPEDFLPFAPIMSAFQLSNGSYGVFLCLKDPEKGAEAQSAMQVAQYHESLNDLPRALVFAKLVLESEPSNRDAVALIADLLIRTGAVQEAIACLDNAIALDPDYHYAYLAVAKLLFAYNADDRALKHLTKLLALDNLAPEIAAEARTLLDRSTTASPDRSSGPRR